MKYIPISIKDLHPLFVQHDSDPWTIYLKLDIPCDQSALGLYHLASFHPSNSISTRLSILAALKNGEKLNLDLRIDRLNRVVYSSSLNVLAVFSRHLSKENKRFLARLLISQLTNKVYE